MRIAKGIWFFMSVERRPASMSAMSDGCSQKTPLLPSTLGNHTILFPTDVENGAIFFVLYVNAEWFAPDAARAHSLRFGRTCFKRTVPLDTPYPAIRGAGLRRAFIKQPRLRTQAVDRRLL